MPRPERYLARDGALRMTAVRQLIIEDRLPEAARLLRPLAYNPRTPPDGSVASLMVALTAGKKTEALGALDKKAGALAAAD